MIGTKNNFLLTGTALGLVTLMSVTSAHGQVTFTPGNNPQPNEENILLNSGLSGASVTGTTQSSGIVVRFDSITDTLTEPSSGQARVEATDGVVNNITISVPGGSFTDLILNADITGTNAPGPGSLDIFVNSSGGPNFFSLPLANGSNFGTLLADPGITITSVTLESVTGFTDLRQPRISGAALGRTPGGVVPEPGSLGLLVGLGITGSAFAAGRIRRRH